MRRFLSSIVLLAWLPAALAADSAPTLEWVNRLPGSGLTSVAGGAADGRGNFYIVGTTSSIDIPTIAAAQGNAGGTPLVRINTATGGADKLYPPGLSAISYLAADPRNPGIFYAAMANGIFKSINYGSSWSPLALLGPNTTIYSLTVDPSNSNTLYAGATKQGVLKSVDGGVNWTSTNSGITPRADGSVDAYQVWVDPNMSPVLFASAAFGGLFRSADGGASWTQIMTPVFSAVVFDPFVPGTLYLGGPVGIVKSTDDGQTFAPLSKLPDPYSVSSLIADPLHAGVLFAAASGGGIFQSADSGATWTQKTTALTKRLAADPNHPVIYADAVYGIVASTDGFTTTTPLGPPETGVAQILVAGSNVFEVAAPTNDVFVWKLDANGNTVYATYFGGGSDDSATAMALGSDGSVYVTGATRSADFPTTAGAYATKMPGYPNTLASFVFKLNPGGSLGWSTYFSNFQSTAEAIAVDAAGNPYVGGASKGNLPTTPGAYQTQFTQTSVCTGFIGCFPGATSAFVTKFDAQGTGLVYSTYVPTDNNKRTVTDALSLAVDTSGNAWFGGHGNVVELNSAGSALLASNFQPGVMINAVALDSNSNLYTTGMSVVGSNGTGFVFPATPGAFQTAPRPAFPVLSPGLTNAFVIKWDSRLSKILAATLLGGEVYDAGESIAIDHAGNVIISGQTFSRALPTHTPFQVAFSGPTGFVAGFDSSLSHLLLSTYLGDEHMFDARTAAVDAQGNVLTVGSTLTGGNPLGRLVANKIALPAPPTVRLDSVVNAASRLAVPIAPGEPIVAVGSGFGADAQLLIDGAPLPAVTATATTLLAIMPDGAKSSGGYRIQASSGGVLSNSVLVPAAPASPAIFSTDGSGFGQGYILNSDGTLNSPTNPASAGSAITIYATGAGAYTLDHGYTVTTLLPTVYIGGFYANGIDAVTGPVAGLPGNVFQLSVYVPDPAKYADQNPYLKNFKFPPQVGIKLGMGPVSPYDYSGTAMISQGGIVLNVQ